MITNANGVLRSTDGGTGWSALNTTLPLLARSDFRRLDPHHPGMVYTSTNDGVYGITFHP